MQKDFCCFPGQRNQVQETQPGPEWPFCSSAILHCSGVPQVVGFSSDSVENVNKLLVRAAHRFEELIGDELTEFRIEADRVDPPEELEEAVCVLHQICSQLVRHLIHLRQGANNITGASTFSLTILKPAGDTTWGNVWDKGH